jgi:hypothetical protein
MVWHIVMFLLEDLSSIWGKDVALLVTRSNNSGPLYYRWAVLLNVTKMHSRSFTLLFFSTSPEMDKLSRFCT